MGGARGHFSIVFRITQPLCRTAWKMLVPDTLNFGASMGGVREGVNWVRGAWILETFSDTWGTFSSSGDL